LKKIYIKSITELSSIAKFPLRLNVYSQTITPALMTCNQMFRGLEYF